MVSFFIIIFSLVVLLILYINIASTLKFSLVGAYKFLLEAPLYYTYLILL